MLTAQSLNRQKRVNGIIRLLNGLMVAKLHWWYGIHHNPVQRVIALMMEMRMPVRPERPPESQSLVALSVSGPGPQRRLLEPPPNQ